MPSTASRDARSTLPRRSASQRNREAFTFARRSRDEDRRARVNRPPFAAGGLLRLRVGGAGGQAPVHARRYIGEAFDPTHADDALL